VLSLISSVGKLLSTITEIDVVLLTKNSVYPCLRDCLLSVKKEVPLKRLIVVDGCSSDETVDLCKSIFPDCKIILDSRVIEQHRDRLV